MKYFEFNNHEYWALVAAESLDKAYEVYKEEVAGDSVEQVKAEGVPKEMLMLDVHNMYARAIRKEDKEISLIQITEDFMKIKDTTVLITSELT